MDIRQENERLSFNIKRPPPDDRIGLPMADAKAAIEHKLVMVDDDTLFSQRLVTGLERYGIRVFRATNRTKAFCLIHEHQPKFAVLELRLLHDQLAHHSGLELITEFRQLRPGMRILVATHHSSIVTAISAIKAGAVNYLPKPVKVDEVAEALLLPYQPPAPRDRPISADRLRWEHMLRVFHQCDQNVSDTARRLKMHRRTLQRMLNKRPPNE